MIQTIYSRTKIIFLTFIFIIVNSNIQAQTVLIPGDLVVTEIGSDAKTFRFVPLVSLSAGTEIYFTDSGWITTSFRANEGAVKYTAPAGGTPAGSNILYSSTAANFTSANDANVGMNDFLLSTGGDQVLVFQGSTANPIFIFACQSNSTEWQQGGATSSNTSALPPGLTDNCTGIAFGFGPGPSDEFDNIWYDCNLISANNTDLLDAVSDPLNWVGDNSTSSACSSTFTILAGGTGPSCSVVSNPITAKIHEVQGSGATVTNNGALTTVEAVVISDLQSADELKGFFIQEEDADADSDAQTSEGIFVFCDTCPVDVMEGDLVEVIGIQEDYFDMSQIDVAEAAANGSVTVMASNQGGLVTATSISLPAANPTNASGTYESIEGMLIEYSNTLTVTEHFQLARYGQVVLSEGGKQRQFTQDNTPSAAGYTAHQINIEKGRIILDDYNDFENIDPVVYPQSGGFSLSNYFRGGSTVNQLKGVMHWSWSGTSGTRAWRIRPAKSCPISFVDSNARTTTPSLTGQLKVCSFNVLNYFNGNGSGGGFPTSRGANSQAELNRQTDKIVSAMMQIDAAVYGLVELENDYSSGANSAIASLVTALNMAIGSSDFAYINPGSNIGTDEITNGFIYNQTLVSPIAVTAILDVSSFIDPNNTGSPKNRPALAQGFQITDPTHTGFQEIFNLVVNHLKSKGSSCGTGDDDTNTGQGNCNGTRTGAAQALATWLATDPTMSGDADYMILGDINAYAKEDPITALIAAGYTDVTSVLNPGSTSFVFSGEWGSLDYIFANASILPQVSDATIWNINADELSLFDYNDLVLDPGEQSFEVKPMINPLYAPDAYRSSDHDPLVVSLDFACPPVLSISGTVASQSYEAGITIHSDGIIPANGIVDYSAGNSIYLNPGFEVMELAEFHAFIQGCN